MGNISSLSVPKQPPAGVATPEAQAEASAALEGKQSETVVKTAEDSNANAEPVKAEPTEAAKTEGTAPAADAAPTTIAPVGLPDDLVAQLAAEEQARIKAIEEAEAEAALQKAFAEEIEREVAKGAAEYEALQSSNPVQADSIIADVTFESAAEAAEANKPVEVVAQVDEPATPAPAPEPTPAPVQEAAPEPAAPAPAADPNAPPTFDVNKFNVLIQNADLMANPEISNFLLSVHQSPELLSNPDVHNFLSALWAQQNP